MPIDASPNQFDEDVAKAKYLLGKMKFKGEGIRASKDLSLISPSSNRDIPPSLLLNGIIVFVPWRSHQEYELMCDTSGLPFALEKSAIQHSMVKSDDTRIALLKMACYSFDALYPDGPKGIVNVGWKCPTTNTQQTSVENDNSKQQCVQGADGPTPIAKHTRGAEALHHHQLQKLANIRMSAINIETAARGNNQQREADS